MIYDENKIALIACVNDEVMYQESLAYIEKLEIPEGMELELLEIQNAESMCSGYQEAMEATDAKYKIYMHQDTFLVYKQILPKIIEIFRRDSSVGIIGLNGCRELSHQKPMWWRSNIRFGQAYNKLSYEYIDHFVYGEFTEDYISVDAMDGIFLATQYDLPWRQDLFHGWHFYDISHTRDFIDAGYKAVIPRQDKPWIMHYAGMKAQDESYYEAMRIFQENYRW